MESKLIKVLLTIVAVCALCGCESQTGPNDPVVDGKKLEQQREKDWSPEDKAAMHPKDPLAPGTMAPGSKAPVGGETHAASK